MYFFFIIILIFLMADILTLAVGNACEPVCRYNTRAPTPVQLYRAHAALWDHSSCPLQHLLSWAESVFKKKDLDRAASPFGLSLSNHYMALASDNAVHLANAHLVPILDHFPNIGLANTVAGSLLHCGLNLTHPVPAGMDLRHM